MKLSSFTEIVSALQSAGVRYIVAGGLAVNAHGYLRFTKDIDIVVQLVPENIERAFADPGMRAGWIRDKNMQVLQFWSDRHPETPIDMFVSEPFPFDQEYDLALVKPLHGTIDVRFVSMPTLIRLKQEAGRTQDLVDVENLKIGVDGNAGN
jgi:hypothetical protein